MKIQKKLQQFIIFLVLLPSIISINFALNMHYDINDTSRIQKPSSSDTRLNGITIIGNSELDTFCSGNGTTGLSWDTAHILKDIIFNTKDAVETCLTLINISRYVKIQNMTFLTTQGSDGLFLQNCTNFEISGLLIKQANHGVNIINSKNITIFDSEIDSDPSNGFKYGIYAVGSENVSVKNFTSNIKFAGIYHVRFEDGNNLTVEQSGFQTDGGGIEIDNCTDVNIHNNTFSNLPDFLFNIVDSSNIDFYNNTCTSVGDSDVDGGSDTNIYENIISDSETIDFRNHFNFTMASNIINSTSRNTIGISNCYNGTLLGNNLSGGGLNIGGMTYDLNILDSNLINGKPIKYIENRDYVKEDLVGFGQIILNDVAHTIISNFSLSGAYRELILINTQNVTVRNCTFSDSYVDGFGISFYAVLDVTIENSTFVACYQGLGGTIENISIQDCVFDGNSISTSAYQVQLNSLNTVSITNSIIRNIENGINANNIDNFYGRNNQFINTTYNFGKNFNVDFDISNLMNGIPIYYLTHEFNQSYTMAEAGGIIIDNCSYLLFSHGSINLNSTAIQIYDSHHIIFYNYSIESYGEYGIEIQNSHNISILYCNISGPYSQAFDVSDCDDLNLTRNYVYNTNGIAYFDDCNNLSITENWFENFTYGLEGEDCDGSIEDNAVINYSGDFAEDFDLENIDFSGNFNSTDYNSTEFGNFLFNLDNFWVWNTQSEGTGQTTTTGTSTTTDTTTSTNSIDPPNPLPTWVIILIVVVGVAVLIAIIIIVKQNT
ncbi:right-handed parallel beta-helix repeat-containing protein [Candidatus Lokiarchaeum ossiferum]|uniref:right-handed parallel beta-helix repeat-containing protein n=1 Tax=Candidatus Lokiarchaeum ossiferum TaxID=2951803 RepID=UPI00352D7184